MARLIGDNSGYVLLFSVLVLGAVGVATILTFLLLGTVGAQNSVAIDNIAKADATADSCLAQALQTIRDNTSYSGFGTATFSTGYCQYQVVQLAGTNRLVYVTGTATGTSQVFYKKLKAEIDKLSPKINVSSTQEIE